MFFRIEWNGDVVTASLESNCLWCGKVIIRTQRRGPTPKFCTISHRDRAGVARRVLNQHLLPSERSYLERVGLMQERSDASV